MIDELRTSFRGRFGRDPQAAARAPARANWIGEHTDYNEGWVLPLAIDRATWVAAAARDDGRVRAVSREQPEPCESGADDPVRRGDWGDYVRGALAALAERGCVTTGADLALRSDVPLGSGLSSSAALCVGVVTVLDAVFSFDLTARERAEIAHRAENHFVGVPCGVMDSFASALCPEGHALLLDCRSLESQPVAIPADAALLVAHSGVIRRLIAGGYATRREECERACRAAREAGLLEAPGGTLRDLPEAQLAELASRVDADAFRRARHVVSENARVHATTRALRAGDLAAAGALLSETMRSLRDDFQVSVPELDALCELGDAAPGVLGSRLTGAGFGGCTLHLVARDAVGDASEVIAKGFEALFGRRPPVFAVRAAAGAEAIPFV